MEINRTIIDELNDIKKSYFNDNIAIFDGLSYSQYKTLKKVEYYTNSQYMTGNKDNLGRQKPFFNIVNAKVNLAITATDLDTKDIEIMAKNPASFDKSFIIRKEVQNWMSESNFALTLNEIGETRARYGGVLIKKVIKNGKLSIEIPEWKNLITDQVDIDKGVKIEKHYMTPAEYSKVHDAFNLNVPIDKVLKLASNKRSLNTTTITKTPTKYVVVWEIHGEFPESMMDTEGKKYRYSNQYHVIVGDEVGKQLSVHAEEESEDEILYKYLAWRKVPGRGLGAGVVEDGFEAQVWTNDAKVREKEIMEIASKIGFKTTDPKMQNNVLTDLDNGFILKLGQGHDIQQLNTVSNAIPEFNNLVKSWDDQYSKVSSTFETNSGDSLPSGTPYRLAVVQSQNANSLFDYRRQELGIFLKEVFDEWVIPFLIKKINKKHILSSDFSHDELKTIDSAFATEEANKQFIERILKGEEVTQETYDQIFNMQLEFIQSTKGRRFLDIPDNYFKDFETTTDIVTTGEQINKAVVLESLNNIVTTVAQNPQILQDPILSQIFGRIIEVTNVGLSPISLGIGVNKPVQTPQQAPQAPQQAVQQGKVQNTQPAPMNGMQSTLPAGNNVTQ